MAPQKAHNSTSKPSLNFQRFQEAFRITPLPGFKKPHFYLPGKFFLLGLMID